MLELGKLMDRVVRVKCIGGRELKGTLRGYDELVNLVLDDSEEYLRGEWLFVCVRCHELLRQRANLWCAKIQRILKRSQRRQENSEYASFAVPRSP